MPKPYEPVALPAHHELHFYVTVQDQEFKLSGVFSLAEGLAAFDRWVAVLGGTDTSQQAQIDALTVKLKAANDALGTTVSTNPVP